MNDQIDILGVKINVTNLSLTFDQITDWIQAKKRTYVCTAPVATIVDCQKDTLYKEIINNSGMTTPDGVPLVWIGRFKGRSSIQRTYGPDLVLTICDKGQDQGIKHFFYGGTEESIRRMIQNIRKKFPEINVVGQYAPPIRAIHAQETDQVIEQINEANPDILWVGLGSPKQDYWMHYHRNRLNVPVIIAVGAAFDFLSGMKPQAPRWMQRIGFEWLFRFGCEPHRLWRRYLIGNTQFLYLLLKDSLKRKANSS